jgi:hypothetical protein
MRAINRARRRFFMRPRYVTRHFGDAVRLLTSKPAIVGRLVTRTLLGQRVADATPEALPSAPGQAVALGRGRV